MSLQHTVIHWIPRVPGLITYLPGQSPRNPNDNAAPLNLPPTLSFFQRISVFQLIERSCSGFPSSPKKLGQIELPWKPPTYRQLVAQMLDLLEEKGIKFGLKVEIEVHWLGEDVTPNLLNAENFREALEWMEKRKWEDCLVVKLYLNR